MNEWIYSSALQALHNRIAIGRSQGPTQGAMNAFGALCPVEETDLFPAKELPACVCVYRRTSRGLGRGGVPHRVYGPSATRLVMAGDSRLSRLHSRLAPSQPKGQCNRMCLQALSPSDNPFSVLSLRHRRPQSAWYLLSTIHLLPAARAPTCWSSGRSTYLR
jgi:hypothetical protein